MLPGSNSEKIQFQKSRFHEKVDSENDSINVYTLVVKSHLIRFLMRQVRFTLLITNNCNNNPAQCDWHTINRVHDSILSIFYKIFHKTKQYFFQKNSVFLSNTQMNHRCVKLGIANSLDQLQDQEREPTIDDEPRVSFRLASSNGANRRENEKSDDNKIRARSRATESEGVHTQTRPARPATRGRL